MSSLDDVLVGTMTIQEALPHWSDPRREQLKYWGETFQVRLQDFHNGHIQTYQEDRGEQVTASQVDTEVDALLALLKQLGLGDEILLYYRSLTERGEITASEINALPATVRRYIDRLKREISNLQAESERMKNQIRKTNWGRTR
jgi:hypothetical protein